ncbi:L-aspartate oxidase [Cobetia sp. UIB-001]|uniref:L-aspartate oxidase n=1 Tax=Cobetia sp. UIB-001 TaxID=2717697 RepID=UPI003850A747
MNSVSGVTPASQHDVLIVGGGAAGLTLALSLANRLPPGPRTRRVTLLRPAREAQGASRWAQGGIAAVLAPEDDVESHVADTLIAGDGLCNERAVRFTVGHSREAIEWLIALGVPFTPADADASYPFHLTREGGHGRRRIIHAADATGRALLDTLSAHVEAHPNIEILEDLLAVDIAVNAGRASGLWVMDGTGQRRWLAANDLVLATGGASGLFAHATSPSASVGDGMAMATRAGASLMNLEFQQFHPTCLYDPDGTPFLISEAVRGEGGLLLRPDGHRFMADHDPRLELAPRDVVARAILAEMRTHGLEHVCLDISALGAEAIEHHFPTIAEHCLARGIDIRHAPIPVVPAAHYSCGGIATGLDGASDLPGLWAIGEVACTGLHGANRMASNSLLECLVQARACGEALGQPRRADEPRLMSTLDSLMPQHAALLTQLADNGQVWRCVMRLSADEARTRLHSLRQLMSLQAGIERSQHGLREALQQIAQWVSLEAGQTAEPEQHRQASAPRAGLDHLALYQALTLAPLLLLSAHQRHESRGLHFIRDFPMPAPRARDSVIRLSAFAAAI